MNSINERDSQRKQTSAVLLDHALAYHRRGLAVIPTYLDKTPAVRWKSIRKQRSTEITLRKLFDRCNADGLAVVLGSASGGLACRDFDDAEAFRRWARAYPRLAATLPIVRTARGFHVYHRAETEKFVTLADGEYRGDTGHYCILPPSPHPSGVRYTWLVPLGDDIPLVEPVSAGLLSRPRHPSSPGTSSRPLHVRHVDTSQVENSGVQAAIEQAIIATLPTAYGQRNRRLFDFARQLKAIPALAALPARTLKDHLLEWHLRALPLIRTKPFEASWSEFVVAWGRVRRPASLAVSPAVAMAAASSQPLCVAAKAYALPEVQRLVMLCREMGRGGGTFYLSCSDAAAATGASDSKVACRWLHMLVADEVLVLARKGRATPKSGVASEWMYVGD